MDIIIVAAAIYGMVIFLLLQMILFRVRNDDEVPTLVVQIWLIAATAVCIVGAMIGDDFRFVATSLIAYSAVSLFYLFVIFSGFESSITLQLLTGIAEAGKKGISRQKLMRRYTVKSVVSSRLSRLAASGEIRKLGRVYLRTEKTSVFLGRRIMHAVLAWCFPVTLK